MFSIPLRSLREGLDHFRSEQYGFATILDLGGLPNLRLDLQNEIIKLSIGCIHCVSVHFEKKLCYK